MDEEDYMAQRDELRSRFRESLKKPLSERYFDEDELIDLFDDAGDTNDDYLRLEIMAVAARFYPDSEPLNQRRCLMYSQLSDVAGKQMLDNCENCSGPMWDILRLRENFDLPTAAIEAALNDILESKQHIGDEEAVQLIRAAADLNQPAWVLNSQKRLIAKCRNRKLVLLECAVAMETMQRYGDSAAILTALVDEDPFSAPDWLMLAQQYLALGEDDKCEQALDYAMALAPDDWQAHLTMGKLLLATDRAGDAIKPLRRAAKGADNSEPLRLLAYALRCQGRNADALTVCRRMLRDFPADDYLVIPDMIVMNPKDSDELLDRFYRANRDNSELFWRSWAERLFSLGETNAAVSVLDCYMRQTALPTLSILPAQLAMERGANPEDVLELLRIYSERCAEAGEPVDEASLTVMHVLSLAQLRRKDEARHLANAFLNKSGSDNPCIQARIAHHGAKSCLTAILKAIDEGYPAGYFRHFRL